MSDTKEVNIGISLPTNVIDNLYNELKMIIGSEKISSANVVKIMINLMKVVEGYGSLSGNQKKALVLHVLELLVDDQIDNEGEAFAIKMLLQTVVPSMIDAIVSVDKGQIKIQVKKCWSKFCCKSK